MRLVGVTQATLDLARARFHVRWSGVTRSRTVLSARRTARRRDASVIVACHRSAVRRAPWIGNCLIRAVALEAALRRNGHAARIRYGVRKDRSEFVAHAWVEWNRGHVGYDAKFRPLSADS